MRTHVISNSDDVIDSRDVIQRIEELFDQLHDGEELSLDGAKDERDAAERNHDECADDWSELVQLLELADEAKGYAPDWKYGEVLIRDSYFETYAQELADDLGLIKADATWPNSCIDWERAARELQTDYTSVEFGDVTYWIRS